jgi:hypothetical protein
VRLKRLIPDLPEGIGPIIELLCEAQENLIEAERGKLRPPARLDNNGELARAVTASQRKDAKRQIEESLRHF